MIFASLNMKL